jgi:O-antigen/teichoic acid export membrane protein
VKSKIVARNSVLNALDTGVSLLMGVATAGIVARSLGPAKMGQYAFAIWLANTMGSFALHGVGAVLNKYLAEYFGKGELAIAKAMVRLGFRIQLTFLLLVGCLSFVYVWWRIPEGQRLFTSLVLATTLPGLLSIPPTMANIAAEDFAANIIPAICSTLLQPLGILLALGLKWGPHTLVPRFELAGLAGGYLFCRVVDLVLRLWFFRNRFPPGLPHVVLPEELRSRMWTFLWHSSALLVLDIIVWERSEMFFLKKFSHPDQAAFYSTGFQFSGVLMSLPASFAMAASASLMVERGRNPSALNRATIATLRYMALMVFPMAAGLAALSGPVIHILYGEKYFPAIPVFALMTLLIIPKALVGPAQWILRAVEKQGFMVRWMIVAALATLTLDYLLVQLYGAMGAAWGNGVGQLVAVLGIWAFAAHTERLTLPWSELTRMAAAAAIMGVIAYSFTLFLPSVAAILIAVPVGVVVYGALLRALRSFAEEDGPRLRGLGSQLPLSLRAWYDGGIRWMLS